MVVRDLLETPPQEQGGDAGADAGKTDGEGAVAPAGPEAKRSRAKRRAASLARADDPLAVAVELVCEEMCIGRAVLLSRRRSLLATRSRQLVVYLAHCSGRVPQAHLAAFVRRERSSVARMLAAVEVLREEPQWEARLARMEKAFEKRKRRA